MDREGAFDGRVPQEGQEEEEDSFFDAREDASQDADPGRQTSRKEEERKRQAGIGGPIFRSVNPDFSEEERRRYVQELERKRREDLEIERVEVEKRRREAEDGQLTKGKNLEAPQPLVGLPSHEDKEVVSEGDIPEPERSRFEKEWREEKAEDGGEETLGEHYDDSQIARSLEEGEGAREQEDDHDLNHDQDGSYGDPNREEPSSAKEGQRPGRKQGKESEEEEQSNPSYWNRLAWYFGQIEERISLHEEGWSRFRSRKVMEVLRKTMRNLSEKKEAERRLGYTPRQSKIWCLHVYHILMLFLRSRYRMVGFQWAEENWRKYLSLKNGTLQSEEGSFRQTLPDPGVGWEGSRKNSILGLDTLPPEESLQLTLLELVDSGNLEDFERLEQIPSFSEEVRRHQDRGERNKSGFPLQEKEDQLGSGQGGRPQEPHRKPNRSRSKAVPLGSSSTSSSPPRQASQRKEDLQVYEYNVKLTGRLGGKKYQPPVHASGSPYPHPSPSLGEVQAQERRVGGKTLGAVTFSPDPIPRAQEDRRSEPARTSSFPTEDEDSLGWDEDPRNFGPPELRPSEPLPSRYPPTRKKVWNYPQTPSSGRRVGRGFFPGLQPARQERGNKTIDSQRREWALGRSPPLALSSSLRGSTNEFFYEADPPLSEVAAPSTPKKVPKPAPKEERQGAAEGNRSSTAPVTGPEKAPPKTLLRVRLGDKLEEPEERIKDKVLEENRVLEKEPPHFWDDALGFYHSQRLGTGESLSREFRLSKEEEQGEKPLDGLRGAGSGRRSPHPRSPPPQEEEGGTCYFRASTKVSGLEDRPKTIPNSQDRLAASTLEEMNILLERFKQDLEKIKATAQLNSTVEDPKDPGGIPSSAHGEGDDLGRERQLPWEEDQSDGFMQALFEEGLGEPFQVPTQDGKTEGPRNSPRRKRRERKSQRSRGGSYPSHVLQPDQSFGTLNGGFPRRLRTEKGDKSHTPRSSGLSKEKLRRTVPPVSSSFSQRRQVRPEVMRKGRSVHLSPSRKLPGLTPTRGTRPRQQRAEKGPKRDIDPPSFSSENEPEEQFYSDGFISDSYLSEEEEEEEQNLTDTQSEEDHRGVAENLAHGKQTRDRRKKRERERERERQRYRDMEGSHTYENQDYSGFSLPNPGKKLEQLITSIFNTTLPQRKPI